MARIKYFDKDTNTWKYADSAIGGGFAPTVTEEILVYASGATVAVTDEILIF